LDAPPPGPGHRRVPRRWWRPGQLGLGQGLSTGDRLEHRLAPATDDARRAARDLAEVGDGAGRRHGQGDERGVAEHLERWTIRAPGEPLAELPERPENSDLPQREIARALEPEERVGVGRTLGHLLGCERGAL